jgi:Ca2+-dependent lipid-binding protein
MASLINYPSVLEARNLEGKDKDGLSDPYFCLDCQGKTFTSKYIKDSLNPQWEEPVFEVYGHPTQNEAFC